MFDKKLEFRYETWEEIPSDLSNAVYAFWYMPTGMCIYIGIAGRMTLADRWKAHWRRSHNDGLRRWLKAHKGSGRIEVCYRPLEARKLERFERLAIKILRPQTNIQHNR